MKMRIAGKVHRLADVKMRRKGENKTTRQVNIDGKTIRGSGFHVVSAWIGEHGLTLGQLTTEEKSNEIKAVPKLSTLLDVKCDVVTADAMSCQKKTAKKIREKGADILSVKENQKRLYEDIRESILRVWRAGRYWRYLKTYGREVKRKGTDGLSGVKSGRWRGLNGLRAVKRGRI
jgi:hypothetical protein